MSQRQDSTVTEQPSSNQKGPQGYRGLENQGSTCYLNVVLQTLFMTKAFRDHVNSLDTNISSDDNLTEELQKLFYKLEKQEQRVVSTTEITKSLSITNVYEQRDAAEHLHLILKKTGSPKLFKGTMKTTITCSSCRNKLQEISEDFLSLQISFQNNQDVEAALQVHVDKMCGKYRMYCEHCRYTKVLEKKSEITNFPEILVIQLRRFEMTNSTHGQTYRKNNLNVSILPRIKVSSNKYELYAIVNHDGSCHAGHYYAEIKCEDKNWWTFNDHSVLESSLNSLFRKKKPTDRSSKACLLMYKKTAGDTEEDQRLQKHPDLMNAISYICHGFFA